MCESYVYTSLTDLSSLVKTILARLESPREMQQRGGGWCCREVCQTPPVCHPSPVHNLVQTTPTLPPLVMPLKPELMCMLFFLCVPPICEWSLWELLGSDPSPYPDVVLHWCNSATCWVWWCLFWDLFLGDLMDSLLQTAEEICCNSSALYHNSAVRDGFGIFNICSPFICSK